MPVRRDSQHPSDSQSSSSTPGVYLRQSDDENTDLDMLWTQASRRQAKEDRQPLFFFGVGFVIGALLTTLVFLLFVIRPSEPTNPVDSSLSSPVEEVSDDLSPQLEEAVEPKAPESSEKAKDEPSKTETATSTSSQSYTVRSGDTLESIARKFYGSGTPKYIEKIQRANGMKNPNQLRLNQKLIIPPKSY